MTKSREVIEELKACVPALLLLAVVLGCGYLVR